MHGLRIAAVALSLGAFIASAVPTATFADGSTLATVAPAVPLAFAAMLSPAAMLRPLATATGGSVRRLLAGPGDTPRLPRVTLRDVAGPRAGDDWIGLSPSRAVVTRGAERTALASGLAAVALLFALFAAVWWREGR